MIITPAKQRSKQSFVLFQFAAALTQLYGAKCYHMMDFQFGGKDHAELFARAIRGKVAGEEWRAFFGGRNYAAGVGFPFAMFYKDMMAAYPDARVVLSTRSPSTWYSSAAGTVVQLRRLGRRLATRLSMLLLHGGAGPSLDDALGTATVHNYPGCRRAERWATWGYCKII